jgi:hypothetical protein
MKAFSNTSIFRTTRATRGKFELRMQTVVCGLVWNFITSPSRKSRYIANNQTVARSRGFPPIRENTKHARCKRIVVEVLSACEDAGIEIVYLFTNMK